MAHTSFSSLVLLIALLKVCSSFPARKSYKDLDPIPLFVMSSLPLEIEEPSNKVEDIFPGRNPRLPGKGTEETGSKSKRTGIFPDNSDSCCPTVVEVIEPLGGKNRSGDLVELYQGDGVRQRFYEVSCAPTIVNQQCRYIDRKHAAFSKCAQQYSYTYALVRDFGVDYDDIENGGWRLDYIQVRSGCSCQVNSSGRHHSSP